MVSSKKSSADNALLHAVESVITRWVSPGQRVTLALSGGIDSVVLLSLLLYARRRVAFQLTALHVNHQLSPYAGRWVEFCRHWCTARAVPLTVIKVTVPRTAMGLEASARDVRYHVFSEQPTDFIALAHHSDDQAETVLLQLLRGAGVKGLSAMPPSRPGRLASPTLLRPLLEMPRAAIEAFAHRHALVWVEDESNRNLAFDRNFLRHKIFPSIAHRFPAYRQTLLRASRHLAEADALLNEVAATDLTHVACDGGLMLAAFRALSPARAKNLLRYFLVTQQIALPSTRRLEEIWRQLCQAKADAQVRLALTAAEIRCFRGVAWIIPPTASPPMLEVPWQGESVLSLPEIRGELVFEQRVGQGLSLRCLAHVVVRLRRGGERLQPDCRRPRRLLKNLLQEAAIPPWRRLVLPLLFSDDRLVWAADIGTDCAFQAATDELGVAVFWREIELTHQSSVSESTPND